MSTRVRALPVCLVVSALVASTGCTPFGGDTAAPRAEWTEVDVSAVESPTGTERVNVTLGRTSFGPGLALGSLSGPRQADTAAVWSDGALSSGNPVLLDVEGDESELLDASPAGKKTYALGRAWREGRWVPFVQSSADHVDWSAVPLPEAATSGDFVATHLAHVPGQGLALVGADADDRPAVLAVESGQVSLLDVEEGSGDGPVEAVGAVAQGRNLVVLLRAPGREGRSVVSAMTSGDLTSFSAPVTLEKQASGVAGVVAVRGRVLVTGTRWSGDDVRAVVWVSDEDGGWTREDPFDEELSSESWTSVSAPVLGKAGSVLAAAQYSDSRWSLVFERSPEGRWQWRDTLEDAPAPGLVPQLVPNEYLALGVRSWQGRTEVVAGRTTLRGWGDPSTAVAGLRHQVVDGAEHLVATRLRYTFPKAGGWKRGWDGTRHVPEGESWAQSSWPVKQWRGDGPYFSEGAGTSVAVTDSWWKRGDKADLRAWWKDPAGTWKEATGLARKGSQQVLGVDRVGDEWFVRATGDDAWVGAWTSSDGKTWREEVVTPKGQRSDAAGLLGACAVRGTVLLVGGRAPKDGEVAPLVWRRDQGEWVTDGSGPEGVDHFTGCAGSQRLALVTAAGADRQSLWSTSDGVDFEQVELPGAEETIVGVDAVAGGFVAVGTTRDGARESAVVWISPDGSTWRSVDVPGEGHRRVDSVSTSGDRVTVASEASSGWELAHLENLPALISALAQED